MFLNKKSILDIKSVLRLRNYCKTNRVSHIQAHSSSYFTAFLLKIVFPKIKIIALTSYNSKSFVANMISVGAVSYLVKNATPQELLRTINEVAAKGFYYDEFVMKNIQDNTCVSKNIKSHLDNNFLTSRELEILKLICEQKNTVEIAEKLFISPRTVEGHRNNLLLKTESKNIAGLVVYAIQNEITLIQ